MIIQYITKITHVKVRHNIDGTKNIANQRRNSCCTFIGFPRDFQLITTNGASQTVPSATVNVPI